MDNSIMQAIRLFLVTNGSEIDISATVGSFRDNLYDYEDTLKASEKLLSEAVSYVFDSVKGSMIAKSGLIMFTVSKLGANPANHKEVTLAVTDYIDANTGNRGDKLFGMRKGRNGGFFRHADRSETDPIYSTVASV